MYKKGVILLSSLLILPTISNFNVTAINNDEGPSGTIEGNYFKFEYKTYTLNKIEDVPFTSCGGVANIINNVTTLSFKLNYPSIDYKELFMDNINLNYKELEIYHKELIYFVEVSGGYQDELTFYDPTRYNIDIIVDIDGITNKFGIYLMTFNAKEIIQRRMVIDFRVDDKTYNFEFNYYDYSGIYYKLNYFETVKEFNEFCNKYGV